MKKTKRFISILLSVVMLSSVIPQGVFAAERDKWGGWELMETFEEVARGTDEEVSENPNGRFEFMYKIHTLGEDAGRMEINVVRRYGTEGRASVTFNAIDITSFYERDYYLEADGKTLPKNEASMPMMYTFMDTVRDSTGEAPDVLDLVLNFAVPVKDNAVVEKLAKESEQKTNMGLRDARNAMAGSASNWESTWRDSVREYNDDETNALFSEFYRNIEGVRHTLTFEDGEFYKSIFIDVVDDDISTAEKQFLIALFDPTDGAQLGDIAETNVIISDNDEAEVAYIGFEKEEYFVHGGGETADVVVQRTSDIHKFLVVNVTNGNDINKDVIFLPENEMRVVTLPKNAGTLTLKAYDENAEVIPAAATTTIVDMTESDTEQTPEESSAASVTTEKTENTENTEETDKPEESDNDESAEAVDTEEPEDETESQASQPEEALESADESADGGAETAVSYTAETIAEHQFAETPSQAVVAATAAAAATPDPVNGITYEREKVTIPATAMFAAKKGSDAGNGTLSHYNAAVAGITMNTMRLSKGYGWIGMYYLGEGYKVKTDASGFPADKVIDKDGNESSLSNGVQYMSGMRTVDIDWQHIAGEEKWYQRNVESEVRELTLDRNENKTSVGGLQLNSHKEEFKRETLTRTILPNDYQGYAFGLLNEDNYKSGFKNYKDNVNLHVYSVTLNKRPYTIALDSTAKPCRIETKFWRSTKASYDSPTQPIEAYATYSIRNYGGATAYEGDTIDFDFTTPNNDVYISAITIKNGDKSTNDWSRRWYDTWTQLTGSHVKLTHYVLNDLHNSGMIKLSGSGKTETGTITCVPELTRYSNTVTIEYDDTKGTMDGFKNGDTFGFYAGDQIQMTNVKGIGQYQTKYCYVYASDSKITANNPGDLVDQLVEYDEQMIINFRPTRRHTKLVVVFEEPDLTVALNPLYAHQADGARGDVFSILDDSKKGNVKSGDISAITEYETDENGMTVYEKDENGELVLDEYGKPIPKMKETEGKFALTAERNADFAASYRLQPITLDEAVSIQSMSLPPAAGLTRRIAWQDMSGFPDLINGKSGSAEKREADEDEQRRRLKLEGSANEAKWQSDYQTVTYGTGYTIRPQLSNSAVYYYWQDVVDESPNTYVGGRVVRKNETIVSRDRVARGDMADTAGDTGIEGARVYLGMQYTTTDTNGHYEFTGITGAGQGERYAITVVYDGATYPSTVNINSATNVTRINPYTVFSPNKLNLEGSSEPTAASYKDEDYVFTFKVEELNPGVSVKEVVAKVYSYDGKQQRLYRDKDGNVQDKFIATEIGSPEVNNTTKNLNRKFTVGPINPATMHGAIEDFVVFEVTGDNGITYPSMHTGVRFIKQLTGVTVDFSIPDADVDKENASTWEDTEIWLLGTVNDAIRATVSFVNGIDEMLTTDRTDDGTANTAELTYDLDPETSEVSGMTGSFGIRASKTKAFSTMGAEDAEVMAALMRGDMTFIKEYAEENIIEESALIVDSEILSANEVDILVGIQLRMTYQTAADTGKASWGFRDLFAIGTVSLSLGWYETATELQLGDVPIVFNYGGTLAFAIMLYWGDEASDFLFEVSDEEEDITIAPRKQRYGHFTGAGEILFTAYGSGGFGKKFISAGLELTYNLEVKITDGCDKGKSTNDLKWGVYVSLWVFRFTIVDFEIFDWVIKEWDNREYDEIYEMSNAARRSMAKALLTDANKAERETYGYKSARGDWNVGRASRASLYSAGASNASVLQSAVYTNSSNKLIELGDDRLLLLFLDLDDNAPEDSNMVTLKYSVYENGMWSVPVIVDNDGTYDAQPSGYVFGDKVVITWANAFVPIEEEDGLNELSAKMSVTAAVYNKADMTPCEGFIEGSDSHIFNVTTKGREYGDIYGDSIPQTIAIGDSLRFYYGKTEYVTQDGELLVGDLINAYDLIMFKQLEKTEEGTYKWTEYPEQYKEQLTENGLDPEDWDNQFLVDLSLDYDVAYTPYSENSPSFYKAEVKEAKAPVTDPNVTYFEATDIDGQYGVIALVNHTKDDTESAHIYMTLSSADTPLLNTEPIRLTLDASEDMAGGTSNARRAMRVSTMLNHNGNPVTELFYMENDEIKTMTLANTETQTDASQGDVSNNLLSETVDGVQVYYVNRSFNQSAGPNESETYFGGEQTVIRRGSAGVENFQVSAGNQNFGIIWEEVVITQNEDGTTSKSKQIMYSGYEHMTVTDEYGTHAAGVFSSPIIWADDVADKANVKDAAVATLSNGDVLAVFNRYLSDTIYGNDIQCDLMFQRVTPAAKVLVTDVMGATASGGLLPGEQLTVGATVKNNAAKYAENVSVELFVDNELIDRLDVTDGYNRRILPGGKEVSITGEWQIPEGFNKGTVKAVAKVNGSEVSSSTLDLERKPVYGLNNIFTEILSRDEAKVSFKIRNSGDLEGAADLVIMQGDKELTRLTTEEIKPYEELRVSINFPIEDSYFTAYAGEDGSLAETAEFSMFGCEKEMVFRLERSANNEQVDNIGRVKPAVENLKSMTVSKTDEVNILEVEKTGVLVSYQVEDTEVAYITSDGTIVPRNEGSTEVTVSARPFNITVNSSPYGAASADDESTLPGDVFVENTITLTVTSSGGSEDPSEPVATSKPGGSSGSSSGASSSTEGAEAQTPLSSVILVDGKEINAGTVRIVDGVAVVTVNQELLNEQLEAAVSNVTVVISSGTDGAEAQLLLKNIADMAGKGMTFVVQFGDITYSLPASAVDLDEVLTALGADDTAQVSISLDIIRKTDDKTLAAVEKAVLSSGDELVVPPVEFRLTAGYNGKTAEISKFNQYVSRTIELTAEQAAKVTTAVAVESGGALRTVPTRLHRQSGKQYAQINSLTNSVYALLNSEKSFTDAKGNWYESAVNEMGSRKVITGVGDGLFAGGRNVTRAEFAAIIVRALGLPTAGTDTHFNDVSSSAWYYGAVNAAYEHGIVSGVGDNLFAPDKMITRQEAMVISMRAAEIAGLTGSEGSIGTFTDAGNVSEWAIEAAKWNVGSGLIVGSNGRLNPKDNLTRAETATLGLKLLQKSGLVDMRTQF